ncbi:MAG TPA: pitrilysin family protein [Thermoanaerobaculia bacterium]|nr:pitrilysin family protein [Thermoanaerobaculia bacterium]
MTQTRTVLAGLCALAISLPAAAQVRRADDLRFPPLRDFAIPQPQRVVLDNGMVVMLLEDHELPLVEATALVRAGSRLDPAAKSGLGELTASVLRTGGTTAMPSQKLDDYLESRAATVEVLPGEAVTRATLSSLVQDFPAVLKVFADVLRRPAFDPQRLEVARNRMITNVARQNDDPGQIVSREFTELVYGPDSPYSRTETFETLRALSRDDLAAWHRENVHPDRIVLGLVGDFRSEEALRLIREAFGDWPRGPASQAAADLPYRKEPSPGVYYVRKDDVTQSNVVLGHLGIERKDPDYYAVEVVNEVLSGSSSSRLFSNIRTLQGLAYSVFGQVGSDWDHPGLTLLYLSTKTETTGAAIASMLTEARNLVGPKPPTDAEVARAKQTILNSFVFNSESRRQVLSQQLAYEAYGYPLDWLSRYRAGIEAVTPEQVRQAAARHLRPADFSILVVGPSEGRDRPLADFGPVQEIDIALPGASHE